MKNKMHCSHINQTFLFHLANSIFSDEVTAHEAVALSVDALNEHSELLRSHDDCVILCAIMLRITAAKQYDHVRDVNMVPFAQCGWTLLNRCKTLPAQDSMSDLDALVFCMPHELLEILLLSWGRGLSLTVISLFLDISTEEAELRLSQARALLLELLEADTPDAPPVEEKEAREMLQQIETAILTSLKQVPGSCTGSGGPSRKQLMLGITVCAAVILATVYMLLPPMDIPATSPEAASKPSGSSVSSASAYPPEKSLSKEALLFESYVRAAPAVLPDNFIWTQHLFRENEGHIFYTDGQGGSIFFSQKRITHETSGEGPLSYEQELRLLESMLSSEGAIEILKLNEHPVAYEASQGIQKLQWYQGERLCAVQTDLEKQRALDFVQSALQNCGVFPYKQKNPQDMAPISYTDLQDVKAQAKQNGDLILTAQGLEGKEALKNFASGCAAKQDEALRIVRIQDDKAVQVMSLQASGGYIYYTDNTWKEGIGCTERGKRCDTLSIEKKDNGFALSLYNADADELLELFSFQ